MMPFDFFESASDTIMNATPNDLYRANQQAFQDEEWTNTSAKTPENGGEILEQQGIGSAEYQAIEAWVKPTVADTSTGLKDTKDFMKLIFRSIDKTSERGLYYKFDNSWWIVHAYNQFAGLPQAVSIRRCNNALRINGLGAPRAFYTPVLRDVKIPNTSYGEDYALGLNISRTYQIGRVYTPVYMCRRWDDNSDASLDVVKMNNNNLYKDRVRTWELEARVAMNKKK